MCGFLHSRRGASAATLLFIAGVIAVMILVAVPVVHHTRAGNHARACSENLARLLVAKERYALDHDLRGGDRITLNDLRTTSPTLLGAVPVCPDGGKYDLQPEGMLPSCSFPGHALPMAAVAAQRAAAAPSTPTTSTAAR